jgi:hypothetical protein
MATSNHHALSSKSTTTRQLGGIAQGHRLVRRTGAEEHDDHAGPGEQRPDRIPVDAPGDHQAERHERQSRAGRDAELAEHPGARPVHREQREGAAGENGGQRGEQGGDPALRAHGVTVGPGRGEKMRAST